MSKFSVQTPHVLASLPRPINAGTGRYVVGEVYGEQPGSKKRKRAELAVGIDGEGVNVYDVATARLVTSYALPPQTVFSCPPTSIRTKVSRTRVDRRTYVSTLAPSQQLSLFHETIDGSTSKTSSTTRTIDNSASPILFLGSISSPQLLNDNLASSDVVAVRENGGIECWSGQDLKERWTSPPSALVREDHISTDDLKVEYAQITSAHTSVQGLLKGRPDVLNLFPEVSADERFNSELLVIVTRASDTRTLRVIAIPRRSSVGLLQQSVEVLSVVELPAQDPASFGENAVYGLHASTGLLQQLSGHRLLTFDLTGALPKVASKMQPKGAQSFLRLSNTAVMVAAESTISVYNPKYRSILARVELDSLEDLDSLKRKRNSQDLASLKNETCRFVTYFPKLGTAIALSGSNLVAFQIEGQLDRQGKPRATGLLIDSLGCSAKDEFQQSHARKSKTSAGISLKTLDLKHIANTPEGFWTTQIAQLDKLASKADAATFDELLSKKLGIDESTQPAVNGDSSKALGLAEDGTHPTRLSAVDKQRWIIYALSKIFTVQEVDGKQRLSMALYPPQVFAWIIREGSMTVRNIELAQKSKFLFQASHLQSGALVDLLEDIDPDMDLVWGLVSHNHLEAGELVHAIKKLMSSLGLFGETALKQALLTNAENIDEDGDPEEQLMRLEAEAENDLAMAEYQLGSGSGVRGQALSVALSKLYTCPDNTITYAIQSILSTTETIGLIGLLRYELSRGGWTSRYVDVGESVLDEDAEVPNHALILIGNLLNNCIDAIGAGGWLAGEARLVNGDTFEAQELITSLKLEVEAAFEGVEQARYLSGIILEMVRYGEQVQRSQPRRGAADEASDKLKTKPSRPKIVPIDEQEKMLPLGLKADQTISRMKVGAGGEISKRTRRDIGHLRSQKVGKYTLERIEV